MKVAQCVHYLAIAYRNCYADRNADLRVRPYYMSLSRLSLKDVITDLLVCLKWAQTQLLLVRLLF